MTSLLARTVSMLHAHVYRVWFLSSCQESFLYASENLMEETAYLTKYGKILSRLLSELARQLKQLLTDLLSRKLQLQ
jgi:hypothetical protein